MVPAEPPLMKSLFRNLFGSRRRGFNPFHRRSRSFGSMANNHRGGMALGSLAALAAPFIVRKLRARHAQRAAYGSPAY
jgi:hypothetical protein